MPGAPGSGGGASSSCAKVRPAIEIQGLRSAAPQTASTRRPPGRTTRRVSASARSGSAMSISPKRQTAPSTESSSSGISSASTTRCSTFRTSSSRARRRATSTISEEKSVEMRRPFSPSAAAASKPVSPGPAASSSMVSPGCGSSARSIESVTGRVNLSSSARRRSQPAAVVCQFSSDVRRYSSRSTASYFRRPSAASRSRLSAGHSFSVS